MGFHKNWDVADIAGQIRRLSTNCSSAYTDGFTAFELKKDLYLIKDIVDRAISESPNFGELEELWLKEREQQLIINILKQKK